MLALSFCAAFMVEQRRLKHTEHAARIAWGAVLARVWVIFLKVFVTLGMAAVLLLGMLFSRLGYQRSLVRRYQRHVPTKLHLAWILSVSEHVVYSGFEAGKSIKLLWLLIFFGFL